MAYCEGVTLRSEQEQSVKSALHLPYSLAVARQEPSQNLRQS